MPDPIDDYKKAVQKAVEAYGDHHEKVTKKAKPLLLDLDKLSDVKKPSPEQKKQIETLNKQLKLLTKELDSGETKLNFDLKKLPAPTLDDSDQAAKFPEWVEHVLNKEIPITKDFTIKPDVDFDIKEMKFNGVNVNFEWKF